MSILDKLTAVATQLLTLIMENSHRFSELDLAALLKDFSKLQEELEQFRKAFSAGDLPDDIAQRYAIRLIALSLAASASIPALQGFAVVLGTFSTQQMTIDIVAKALKRTFEMGPIVIAKYETHSETVKSWLQNQKRDYQRGKDRRAYNKSLRNGSFGFQLPDWA